MLRISEFFYRIDIKNRSPLSQKNLTHPLIGTSPLSLITYSRINIYGYPSTRLSKALVTDAKKLEWRSPEVLKEQYGVTLRTSTEVASVSPKDHTVTLTTGEVVEYEGLVLSPGSVPRRIPIPGAKEGELGGVFTLRGIKDAKEISEGECYHLPVHRAWCFGYEYLLYPSVGPG